MQHTPVFVATLDKLGKFHRKGLCRKKLVESQVNWGIELAQKLKLPPDVSWKSFTNHGGSFVNTHREASPKNIQCCIVILNKP